MTTAGARFARDRGQFDRAETLLEEVRTLAVESGDDAALASALTQLGRSASLEGDGQVALELQKQAVVLRRAGDDRVRLGGALYHLGLSFAAAARAALGDAEYERLTAEGAALGLDAAVELALELSAAHGAPVD